MKKLLTLLLVLCLGIAFVGCDEEDDDDDENSSSGSSYEMALDKYFKAIEEGDGEMIKNCMPLYQIEYMEKQRGDDFDIDEYYEKMGDQMLEYLEHDYGDNIKITYKIKEDVKFKSEKLDDIEDDIEDKYDVDVDVSAAYKLKVKMTIKGDEDDDVDNITMTVSKIDGKWYITDGGLL